MHPSVALATEEERMRSLLLAATAAVALTGTAQAAQITLNNSTAGTITFTGDGSGNISVSTTTLSGKGSDEVNLTLGNYSIAAIGPVTATAAGSGVWNFPAGTTSTFQYTNGADAITETWTFSTVNDGSVNPHFKGTDLVTAISGSAAFQAAYGPVGSTSTVDFATTNVATVLDALAETENSETATISSGEDVKTPEPATLGLLGLGLLGLGVVTARRRR